MKNTNNSNIDVENYSLQSVSHQNRAKLIKKECKNAKK